MKASVCLVPSLHVESLFTGMVRGLGGIEDRPCEMRRCMTQRQHFQGGSHFGHLFHLVETETRDPHPPARLADDQPLRLQSPKGFTHRHMTGTELVGNVILPEPCPGGDHAGNYSLGKFSTDTGGDRV